MPLLKTMKYNTPKTGMLLDAIDESLADLSTECWNKETRNQLKKVEDEQDKLKSLLLEENAT
ncbi:hypothetical protein LCGC14_0752850 [marine sediment metagenome]|uniref:Uncharacterized protein n=1 Tax=marine sediment metagenome TaxID=412755 RepID=A0A0F9SNK3_9ZZZZ